MIKTAALKVSKSTPLKTQRNKYGVADKADRTHAGMVFASKGEMVRWLNLKNLERAGDIKDLVRQVPFVLAVNGQTICKYIADFRYCEAGKIVVEDFKGAITAEFRLKQKLMKACCGIEIKITGRGRV